MAASNYVFLDQVIGKANAPTDTGTVQLWPLGLTAGARYNATNSTMTDMGFGEFVYVQGSTNSAGCCVFLAGNTAKVLASNTNFGSAGPVGIAPAAMSNTNVYGWVQVRGICDYAVANSTLAVGDQAIVGSGTAGILGKVAADATTGSNRIAGMAFVSSASASTANCVVHMVYPTVRGV